MICFIDSNIWFYYLSNKDDLNKTTIAEKIIFNPQQDIVLSVQVINEVCFNLIRKKKLPEEKIQNVIVDFYQGFDVANLNEDIFLKASEIRNKHSFSYWDSLIFATALDSHADILYSEDMQNGFVLDGLEIVNPFA